MLINLYLQQGENQLALTLAEAYPQDVLAEVQFGRVLAQYRMGNLQAAQSTLKTVSNKLPLIVKYLLQTSAKKTEFNEFGIIQGGKDQAWLYRDKMRESWQLQTDGCMACLKERV